MRLDPFFSALCCHQNISPDPTNRNSPQRTPCAGCCRSEVQRQQCFRPRALCLLKSVGLDWTDQIEQLNNSTVEINNKQLLFKGEQQMPLQVLVLSEDHTANMPLIWKKARVTCWSAVLCFIRLDRSLCLFSELNMQNRSWKSPGLLWSPSDNLTPLWGSRGFVLSSCRPGNK